MINLGPIKSAIENSATTLFTLLRGITAQQKRTNELLAELVMLERTANPVAARAVRSARQQAGLWGPDDGGVE